MLQNIITLILMFAVLGSSAAQALTVNQMSESGSAITWRETDRDMRRMDIEDYMRSQNLEPSPEKIPEIEACIKRQLMAYTHVNVGDKSGPALAPILNLCAK